MYTPQQLAELGFTKAVFGGYDMDSVHAALDPLIEDYTTLYKENAVLKSKLRILVEKLEEYRRQEQAPQANVGNAEAEAARIIEDAKKRAARIVAEASAAEASAPVTMTGLDEQTMQEAHGCIKTLEQNLRQLSALLDLPAPLPDKKPVAQAAQPAAPASKPATPASNPVPLVSTPVLPVTPAESPEDIAKEIEQSIERLISDVPVSTYDASAQDMRVMPPLHPESITAKFGDLQFGKNYTPK